MPAFVRKALRLVRRLLPELVVVGTLIAAVALGLLDERHRPIWREAIAPGVAGLVVYGLVGLAPRGGGLGSALLAVVLGGPATAQTVGCGAHLDGAGQAGAGSRRAGALVAVATAVATLSPLGHPAVLGGLDLRYLELAALPALATVAVAVAVDRPPMTRPSAEDPRDPAIRSLPLRSAVAATLLAALVRLSSGSWQAARGLPWLWHHHGAIALFGAGAGVGLFPSPAIAALWSRDVVHLAVGLPDAGARAVALGLAWSPLVPMATALATAGWRASLWTLAFLLPGLLVAAALVAAQ